MNNNDNGSNKKALYDKKDREKKEIKEGVLDTSRNQVQRDKHGRLLPGSQLNPLGPTVKKKVQISLDTLIDSLKEVEKAKQKPFLKHLWERAYRSDTMAKAMLDKFIANKGIDIADLHGGGQFNVIIQTFSGEDKQERTINITPKEHQSKE